MHDFLERFGEVAASVIKVGQTVYLRAESVVALAAKLALDDSENMRAAR
ncbi:MAG TPA: hypothetical protein VF601_11245 [Beijerinckiaceae bacterium]